jgi:hypothetical protein
LRSCKLAILGFGDEKRSRRGADGEVISDREAREEEVEELKVES